MDLDLIKEELKLYSNYHSTHIEPFGKKYTQMIASVNDVRVLAPDGTTAEITHLSDNFRKYIEHGNDQIMRVFNSKLKEVMYKDLFSGHIPGG